jgi:hypothetical protein
MDIIDFLSRINDYSRSGYGQMVIWAGIIGLIVLYVIVRWIGSAIYYALFPSKRPWRTKTFDEEAEEHRNQPLNAGPESIGSVSVRLGEDLRDVWEMGYSNDQIDGVLTGKYSLQEMYKMQPDGNTVSSKGKEILGSKELLT